MPLHSEVRTSCHYFSCLCTHPSSYCVFSDVSGIMECGLHTRNCDLRHDKTSGRVLANLWDLLRCKPEEMTAATVLKRNRCFVNFSQEQDVFFTFSFLRSCLNGPRTSASRTYYGLIRTTTYSSGVRADAINLLDCLSPCVASTCN